VDAVLVFGAAAMAAGRAVALARARRLAMEEA
jgi:hypothetical protein